MPAKLILSMDGLVLKEIALTKERTTIGRKPHNDIQIDNLAVSGEHAVIVTILNDSFLEDLGSTNGTLVNGQPIKKHFLQTNDVVELGKYKLKYINDQGQKSTAPQDFERTMVLRPGAVPKADAPKPSTSQAVPTMGASQPTDDGRLAAHADRGAVRLAAGEAGLRLAGRADHGQLAADVGVAAARPRRQGRGHPAPLGLERRQGDGAHQGPHDARQAGRAGRGHHQAAAGLLHHPRRGRELPDRQRQARSTRRRTRSTTTTSSSSPA